MLLSIVYVLMVGMVTGWFCRKLHLLSPAGMILTGVALGPYVLDLIDGSILETSTELRKTALIITLMRADLFPNVDDLKRVGHPAILICLVLACSEIVDVVALASRLLGISMLEVAIVGSVVVTVPPTVVVPKMIRLMEEGHGTENGILQLVLTGVSVDDMFVTVLFSALTGLAQGTQVSAVSFIQIPLSILAGIPIGVAVGVLPAVYFRKTHIRDTIKVIILLYIPFVLISFEDSLKDVFSFSSPTSVMCMGIAPQKKREPVIGRLSLKFNKLWVGAEILLLMLVDATVDISYAVVAGSVAVLLILDVLVFRVAGVVCCLVGTKLNLKEWIFCVAVYMPEATVQVATDRAPLSIGLACGSIVLTVAVLAILITAPLGAFPADLTYRRWLTQEY